MNIWFLGAFFWILGLFTGCHSSSAWESTEGGPKPQRYLVVSLVPPGDGFIQAGQILARRHNGQSIAANPNQIADLLPQFQKIEPDYVAFVVRPNDLDVNLVQQIFSLATQVDADPFVDFCYGFVTGRDAEAAIKLVQASQVAPRDDPAIAQFGVASSQLPRSMEQRSSWPLRRGHVPITAFMSRGASDKERDSKFITEAMPKLEDSPILVLASHGYPDGLVGGPKAADIRGRDFSGSVAFNIACYNGVTSTWFEDDWTTGKVCQRHVDEQESFCLQMIDAGVAAYIAYACPRPAGPTMMGDSMRLASSGQSVGELQRQVANSIVLAHLMSGSDSVEVRVLSDGDPLAGNRTPGKIVRAMSTGGMLIGDPAFVPFHKKQGADPVIQTIENQDDNIFVNVQVGTPIFHFYASEPLNYWNERTPAMRLETVVPLHEQEVIAVQLVDSSFGNVPSRLVAAIETHQGQRLLHVKSVFEQPPITTMQNWTADGIKGKFEISTVTDNTSHTQSTIFRHEADSP